MSKEFQIRDGNLIASFDLENEDGDIDFCKLLKVSKGVADEIGMFVDYVATNKIIKDQSKQISDLEAKLAESEEQLKEELEEKNGIRRALKACHHQNDEFADMIKKLVSEKGELKQQLVEKEKERHEEWKVGKEWKWEWQRVNQKLEKADQDKISFALEQLEKVKELLLSKAIQITGTSVDGVRLYSINEIFSNQIKQLKERK